MAPRRSSFLAVLLLLVAIAVVSLRTFDQRVDLSDPGSAHSGLCDFRDGVYFPTLGFFEGANPYAREPYVDAYPVGDHYPLYSPIAFVMHAPFVLLPFDAAAIVFYLLSVAATVALGAVCLRWAGVAPRLGTIAAVGAFLVASRPGLMNLFDGQVTLQAVFATYAGVWYARRRPWLGALGLAVATFKGPFGAPLAILMWARGDRRAVLGGLALAAVLTLPAAGWLVHGSGGLAPFMASLHADYQSRFTVAEKRPESSPYRIDVVALAARTMGHSPTNTETALLTLGVLALAAAALRRLRDRDGRDDRLHAASIAMLAIIACGYHQAYDALLLTLPLIVAGRRRNLAAWHAYPQLRPAALILVGIPFVNYCSAGVGAAWFGDGLQLAASSVSALAILGSLVLHAGVTLREPAADAETSVATTATVQPGEPLPA
jgi:hypothetical protein